MTLRLVVLISTQPGLAHRQLDAFARLAPLVRAEPGCRQYDLHPVDGEPDRFVLLEEWESPEHLRAHGETAHMREAAADSAEFRDGAAQLLRLGPEATG
ncbi:MAG: antibiotic biosynthesis monooxygenase [Actinomycetota bacterium]|nr:antibiotic biosynthesis monooxygenase [Actinomycetota bacterium]